MTSYNDDPPALRAAIYARISADPTGHAVGVTDQARQCRQLADARGWLVVRPGCTCTDCKRYGVPADVYCDNDITASGKKKRPHYERLLGDVAAGRIDRVIVLHTDRLHRSPVELENYINVCEPRSVETHTIQAGTVDLTTANGRMVARMFGAMARAELEHMMERQGNAKARNRKHGLRSSGYAPFGFRHDVRDARGAQIPGVSKGLVIEEDEAELIRSGYADLLAGKTLASIARKWNDSGLRTQVRTTKSGTIGGKDWSVVTVRYVLLRAANAGLIEYEDRTKGKPRSNFKNRILEGRGAWDPIVSEDTWRAAKAILSDPARRTAPGPKPAHLLTGVLVCGVCGSRGFRVLRHRSADGTPVPRYICRGRHVARREDQLDEWITELVLERLRRPDVLAAFAAAPAIDQAELETRRAAITVELDEIAASRFPLRQKSAMAEPLIAELEDVEKRIAEALQGTAMPELAGGADPAVVWDKLPIDRKRFIVRSLMTVRLHKARQLGPPKGWKPGQPYPFDYDSVEIIPEV